MKLVVSSDWHGDAATHGVTRFEEVEAAAKATAFEAIRRKADMYVFLGDLCDPDSGSSVFRCVRLALHIARVLTAAKIPSIWLAGNHDVIEDGTGETTLSPLREAGGMAVVAEQFEPVSFGGLVFACMPFVAATSPGSRMEAREFLQPLTSRDRTVVLSHLNVSGVVPGDEADMPRGREVLLPEELAHERAKLVLQGHYHRRQKTSLGTWIPGSLARLAFGEENNEPGFLAVEV